MVSVDVQTQDRSTRTLDKTRRVLVIAALLACVLALLGGCGSSFDIVGTWENTGDGEYGQAYEKGSLIQFGSNGKCNLYSPRDTYAFKKESGGDYKLVIKGLLGGGGEFKVNVKDKDHIEITKGSTTLEMERVG